MTGDRGQAVTLAANRRPQRGRQCLIQLAFDHGLDETAHPIAHPSFDRIEPIVKRYTAGHSGTRAQARQGPLVATNDFSGFVIFVCALANATARQAMDSPDRCMAALLDEQVEVHGTGLRALGPDATADRLLGILGHQCFEFGLRLLVFWMGRPGSGEDISEFCPGIRAAHIDTADSLDARPLAGPLRTGRGVTALHAAPELPLSSDEEVLVDGIGIDFNFNPPAAAGTIPTPGR